MPVVVPKTVLPEMSGGATSAAVDDDAVAGDVVDGVVGDRRAGPPATSMPPGAKMEMS